MQHGIGGQELWVSSTAIALEQQAESCFDLAAEISGARDHAHIAKAMQLNLRGLSFERAARREARVDVGEMLAGKCFDAMTVAECAAAEIGIRRGFEALQKQMLLLARYDAGEEDLTDPEQTSGGLPPGQWQPPRGD